MHTYSHTCSTRGRTGVLVVLCPVRESGVEVSEEVEICLRRGLCVGVCTPDRDGHGLPTSAYSLGVPEEKRERNR